VTHSPAKTPRALLAGLSVFSAGALGYIAYQLVAADDLAAVTASAAATPLAASDAPATAPADEAAAAAGSKNRVPDTLPDITLANLAGKPTRLASFGGRPLMINFWATWCAPCRREIPLLNKLRSQRKARNAEIVGVAVDFREDVLKYVQTTPINYPLLMGEEDGLAAAEAFGMGMAFPFSVFVDHENRILTIKVGELHEDEANFAFDRLQDIADGVLTRAAAQAAVAEAFRQMAAQRALAIDGEPADHE
jgi:thiol-disulfide isomerase/thioredoxin